MGPVPKNRTNQNTLPPIDDWSLVAQKIAIPKKMTSQDGNPKMTVAAMRITDGILAHEESTNCGTPGMENTHANTRRLKTTTAEQRNRMEAAFDSSQLNFISDLG